MVSLSERDLLKGAKEFDPASLGAIYDQFSPGIFRYAMRLLGNEVYAEDCVSETFSRFLKALSCGQGPNEHLQAYLYRIAHNWVTDCFREDTAITVEWDESYPADNDLPPEHEAEIGIQRQEVRNALRYLTTDQRQVIYLRFIEGWDNDEVAAALGKPVNSIKMLQHRAVNMLKKILTDKEKANVNVFKG